MSGEHEDLDFPPKRRVGLPKPLAACLAGRTSADSKVCQLSGLWGWTLWKGRTEVAGTRHT